MAIEDDIAVDSSGNFYYTGAVHGAAGAGYYSVIEFHRYAQDLADDAVASGDDLIDITSETPTDRSTDNIIRILTGYRLDDTNGSATDPISEHLFDGSIIQDDDDSIWDGLVVIAAEGMDLQILQNGDLADNTGAFWNTVPNGETLKGLNRDVANGISHRFMLKVRNAGADIDGRRIVGLTREIGFTYSEFRVNGTARGNNVLALTYVNDLNDSTDASGRNTITNTTEGYALLDIDGNSTPEPYYSEWNRATFTINQFYERMKWLTAAEDGSTADTENATLYGLAGNIFRGITNELGLTTPRTGTFNAFEPVTWSGGTGQMLAIDSPSTGTRMWIQVLTGTAPSSGVITGTTSSATATVNANTERPVSTPFCGVSTGSALIGAYGFGLETADTSASDLFLDLDGNTNQPPNNVTFIVGGVVNGEDRILVGPANGSALRVDQGDLQGATTGGEASITVSSGSETLGTGTPSAIDTPSTGTIRVLGNDGIYARVTYTGRTFGAGTITFTGCTGVPAAADNNNVFISYVDELYDGTTSTDRFTVVYSNTPRDLFIRVRDGGTAGDLEGIKTFETTGQLGAAGGSTTAIRTSDA